jgi:hypothetical protein
MTNYQSDPIEKKPVTFIKKYWTIIVAIFLLGTGFATFKSQLVDNATRITNVEAQQRSDELEQAASNTQILTQLSQIQTDLSWIKSKLK